MHYSKLLAPNFYRNFIFLRLLNGTTKYSTRPDSHYEMLGVSSKATQTEVKAAYYKQSKIYHPDKSGGSDAAVRKFRSISEAYEVLGNIKLRRLYDKGFLQLKTNDRNYNEDPSVNFYRSRRNRPAPPTGRTPIYDFDEWAKTHYGATFAKDMSIKARQRKEKGQEQIEITQQQSEQALFAVMLSVVILMYLVIPSGNRHDRVVKEPFDQ